MCYCDQQCITVISNASPSVLVLHSVVSLVIPPSKPGQADDILSEAEKLGWKGLAAAVRRDMREAYGDDLWSVAITSQLSSHLDLQSLWVVCHPCPLCPPQD